MADNIHKRILDTYRMKLKNDMDLMDSCVLDCLKQKNALSDQQLERIESKATNNGRASALIEILKKRSYEDFLTFIECLHTCDHKHVAKYLGFARPNVCFILPPEDAKDIELKLIIGVMKDTIRFVDEDVETDILTTIPEIKCSEKTKIIGVLPHTAGDAYAYAGNKNERNLCCVVTSSIEKVQKNLRPKVERRRYCCSLSNRITPEREVVAQMSEQVRCLNSAKLNCFLAYSLLENWQPQCDSFRPDQCFAYIPTMVVAYEERLVPEEFTKPIRVVIYARDVEDITQSLLAIARAMIEFGDELELDLLHGPSFVLKSHELATQLKKLPKVKLIEYNSEFEINEMKINAIWIFPGGEEYVSWTMLRPFIHGIPNIISRSSQLIPLLAKIPDDIGENVFWDNTSDIDQSVNSLKRSLRYLLENKSRAFEHARLLTKWFMCSEPVINSAHRFLQFVFEDNSLKITTRVLDNRDHIYEKIKDALRCAYSLGGDSELHKLIRKSWDRWFSQLPVLGIEGGCIIHYVYVADIEALTRLRDSQEKPAEAMLELLLILWRSHFHNVMISDACLEIEISSAIATNQVPQDEKIEAFMNTVELDGRDVCFRAASAGATDSLEYLISENFSVNRHDKNGNLPLTEACRAGHVKTVDFLMDKTSNFTILDLDNALHSANEAGHHEVARILESRYEQSALLYNSSVDETITEKLVEDLEKHGVKCIYPTRDFLSSFTIFNILERTEESQNVIIVGTNESCKTNQWKYEVTTVLRETQLKKRTVIAILSTDEMPNELRSQICISYSDKPIIHEVKRKLKAGSKAAIGTNLTDANRRQIQGASNYI